MEPKRYTWADSDSESDQDEQSERVLTSLPSIQETVTAEPRKKKKKRVEVEEEAKSDPNLVTKIIQQKKPAPTVYLRDDGTPMTKKEIKQKELEDMDSLLNELGVKEESTEVDQTAATETKKAKVQAGAKPANRAVINAVRAEITARQEKAKSQKKNKQKYPR